MKQHRRPIIVVDTREQNPWLFAGRRVLLKRFTLPTGDYSVAGSRDMVAIERKSLQDLFSTMTAGRERFRRELERLGKYRIGVLLVEADLATILRGSPMTGIAPDRMVSTLFGWCAASGVVPVFAPGRAEAERWAAEMLEAVAAVKLGGGGGGQ